MRNHHTTINANGELRSQFSPVGKSRRRWEKPESPRPRVLLADDDLAVRHLLLYWLEEAGFEVEVARNGEEAWKILVEDGAPELLIMDWMMPGIDGMEICRRLRRRQADFYQYVLLISGRGQKQNIASALEAGADDYLVKPFDLDELRSRLAVALRIISVQRQLIDARESLRTQATKDGLTGVWNRVSFLELFKAELDRASRSGATTGLLMLDIDHFKRINDTFGHLTGDLALVEITGRVKRLLRPYDFLGRYGGEEFLIALPGVTQAQLYEIAERIRLSIAKDPVTQGKMGINVSVSIGAVGVSAGRKDPMQAIAIADSALYRAKNMGRNRTVACQKPWRGPAQSDGNSSSLCNACHQDGASEDCDAESKSSHWGWLNPRRLWPILTFKAGGRPVIETGA